MTPLEEYEIMRSRKDAVTDRVITVLCVVIIMICIGVFACSG